MKQLEELLPGRHAVETLEKLLQRADGDVDAAVDLFYGGSSSSSSKKASTPVKSSNGPLKKKPRTSSTPTPQSSILTFFGKTGEPAPAISQKSTRTPANKQDKDAANSAKKDLEEDDAIIILDDDDECDDRRSRHKNGAQNQVMDEFVSLDSNDSKHTSSSPEPLTSSGKKQAAQNATSVKQTEKKIATTSQDAVVKKEGKNVVATQQQKTCVKSEGIAAKKEEETIDLCEMIKEESSESTAAQSKAMSLSVASAGTVTALYVRSCTDVFVHVCMHA